MSEPEAPRAWRFYAEDMLSFCDRALSYGQDLRMLCITHCGLWQHGLGRSAALIFLPIAELLAAKLALQPIPIRATTASQELCRASLDRTSFTSDRMRYDAILRNLELISEAATHVPSDIRVTAPLVPWRLVVALRNRLIHGYLGIDDDTLWSIVQDELPALQLALKDLLGRG